MSTRTDHRPLCLSVLNLITFPSCCLQPLSALTHDTVKSVATRCFRCCDFVMRLNFAACDKSPNMLSAGRKLVKSILFFFFRTRSISIGEKHAFDQSTHRKGGRLKLKGSTKNGGRFGLSLLLSFAFLTKIPNSARRQRGETNHPRCRSLNPSSYWTSFYLIDPGEVRRKRRLFELTRKQPVEYQSGGWQASVWQVDAMCPPHETNAWPTAFVTIRGCKASCSIYFSSTPHR